ncbi:MAG: monovalent cation/H(+) antiporter subunit G [Desulfurococcaceae archaeon]
MLGSVLTYIGVVLVVLGGFAIIVSAIGMHRFKNFYLRLHAATVGTIWGCVFPVIGVSLIAFSMEELDPYRWFMGGAGLVTAFTVLILAPAGSHALARATHRAKVEVVKPCVYNALDRELCVGDNK